MINTAPFVSYLHGLAITDLIGLVVGTCLALVVKSIADKREMPRRTQALLARGVLTLSVFLPAAVYWATVHH